MKETARTIENDRIKHFDFRQALRLVALLLASGLATGSWGRSKPPEYAVFGVHRKPDKPAAVGDPISAASGAFSWSKQLASLGGPMHLGFSIHYRTDPNAYYVRAPGDFPPGEVFDDTMYPFLNAWSWQPAPLLLGNSWYDMTVLLEDGGQVCFVPDGDDFVFANILGFSGGVDKNYQLKKIDNWFYFCDPVRGRVTMFQLLPSGGTRFYRPETVMDRNMNCLTYSYRFNFHCNPSAIADDEGRALYFDYEWYEWGVPWDIRYRLTSVTDHVERAWNFLYDEAAADNGGRMTLRAVVEPGDRTNTFLYQPNTFSYPSGNLAGDLSLLVSVIEPLGNATFSNEYASSSLDGSTDPHVRCTVQTDACGNRLTLTMSYEAGNYVGNVTNPDGTTNRFVHHSHHDVPPASIRDGAGNAMMFARNIAGHLHSTTDREGALTAFGYNGTRRLLTGITNACDEGIAIAWEAVTQEFQNPANNHVVSFAFDQVARIDYADGSSEHFAYDGRGNLTSRTDRAGSVWTTTHDERGRPLVTTRPGGGTLTRTWSSNGLLVALADSDGFAETYGYDELFRVTSITNADGAARQIVYDVMDRVARITDEHGQSTDFARDANGNLTGVMGPAGAAIEFERDLMNRVVRQADPLGVILETEYDAMGRVAARIDPAGTTRYGYHPNGWITNQVRGTRSRSWQYDREGRITNSVSALGHAVAIARDALGRPVTVTDPLSNATTIAYDRRGRIALVHDPRGAATGFDYDAEGRLTAVSNALGAVALNVYDANGNPTSTTDFDGNPTTFGFTPMGRLAAVSNALGQATRFAYDAGGRLIRTDHADGTSTTRSYDAAGRVTAFTDEATNVWSIGYDALARVTSVTNPVGGVAAITYNPDGSVQTRTDSDTLIVSNRYDAARRLVETVLPDGSGILYEHNEHHELVAVTDALGHETRFTYDAAGRLTKITDALGHDTDYAYDGEGRLIQRTDRSGGVVDYEYDAAGRLVAVTDPTGVSTLFARDALGRATNIAIGASSRRMAYNASGVATNIAMSSGRAVTRVTDALQRIVRTVDALGETNAVAYDARGRIAAVTDPAGRITQYAYDPRGQLAAVTLPGDESVAYQWNEIGRLSHVADFNGATFEFDYTPMGRLLSLTDPLDRVTRYAYDERGRLAGVEWADGETADYERDAANGAVVRIAHDSGLDLRFGRDALGRLTNANDIAFVRDPEGRIVATENPGTVFDASYDAAGRLTSLTYPLTGLEEVFTVSYSYAVGPDGDGALARVSDDLTGTQIDFAYDADRRLHTISLPNGEMIVYTWDAADRMVRLQSGHHVDVGLTYDRSGCVVAADFNAPLVPSTLNLQPSTLNLSVDAASQLDGSDFEYDARGRLTRATIEQRQSHFIWDAASRLISMTQSNVNPHTATYAYNGLGQTRTRADGTNTLRFHYNHAIGMTPIVAEQDEASGQMLRYYVWSPAGRLLYLIDAANGNQVYFYHFDAGGNTLALTDTHAAVTDAWAYDPYGRVVARTGSHPQPFTFDGAWGVRQDGDNGLYQMRARWYDALSARFLSPEPIWPQLAEPKALNPYQYAGADPIRFADPSGLSLIDTLAAFDPQTNIWFEEDGNKEPKTPIPIGSLNTLHCFYPALAKWFPDDIDAPAGPKLSTTADMIAKNLGYQFEQLQSDLSSNTLISPASASGVTPEHLAPLTSVATPTSDDEEEVRIGIRIAFSEKYACPMYTQAILNARIKQRATVRRDIEKFGREDGWSQTEIDARIQEELSSGSFDLSNFHKALDLNKGDPIELHAIMHDQGNPGGRFIGPVRWVADFGNIKVLLGQGEHLRLNPQQAEVLRDLARRYNSGVLNIHAESTYRDDVGTDPFGTRVQIGFRW